MSSEINLNVIDADGFKNPVVSPLSRFYRLGYVVGWLHGAGFVRISFRTKQVPRGTALLSITRAGLAFLKKNRPGRPKSSKGGRRGKRQSTQK